MQCRSPYPALLSQFVPSQMPSASRRTSNTASASANIVPTDTHCTIPTRSRLLITLPVHYDLADARPELSSSSPAKRREQSTLFRLARVRGGAAAHRPTPVPAALYFDSSSGQQHESIESRDQFFKLYYRMMYQSEPTILTEQPKLARFLRDGCTPLQFY
jgi:hypothetical protein